MGVGEDDGLGDGLGVAAVVVVIFAVVVVAFVIVVVVEKEFWFMLISTMLVYEGLFLDQINYFSSFLC